MLPSSGAFSNWKYTGTCRKATEKRRFRRDPSGSGDRNHRPGFDSFLKVHYELPQILNDENKKNYFKVDHYSLESLFIDLKRFYDGVTKLSCDKTPTIHLVVPYKQFFINLSIVNDNDDELIISFKKYISKELPDYWVLNNIHFIATMLHPILIIYHTKGIWQKHC